MKLQKELERLKTVETKIMKEKQKTKEQEKAITKLETSLAETKSELDKTQVRCLGSPLFYNLIVLILLNRCGTARGWG